MGSTPTLETVWHDDAIGRHLRLRIWVLWVRVPLVLLDGLVVEWYTRKSQKLVPLRACGFESHQGYYAGMSGIGIPSSFKN